MTRRVANKRVPRSHRIAQRIASEPALLGLCSRRLEADVRAVYGVGPTLARAAVVQARRCAA